MGKFFGLWAVFVVAAAAQSSRPCIKFSVVSFDKLNNVKQGLSPGDQKWFREKIEKKYPSVCYAPPSPAVSLVFVVLVTPATYDGTRVVRNTQSNPIDGTITDNQGDSADISGTQQTTTSTAVPYSFDYGIFTLSVEQHEASGSYVVLHRFQERGIYRTMYGIPLGGKGHHPFHAVVQEAAEWISKGDWPKRRKCTRSLLHPQTAKATRTIPKHWARLNLSRYLGQFWIFPRRPQEPKSTLTELMWAIHPQACKSRSANTS